MPDGLPEHFAVVGPAWLDFERAVRAAGAVGEDLAAQLDSLRARLSPATLDTAHQLRRQRNALFHDGTLIRDLRGWEAQCRRTIAELQASRSRSARNSAGARRSSSRALRSPLGRLALIFLVAALAALALVAYAWFESASVCGGAADRLACTFDTATYLRTALAAIAALGIALASFLTRRRRR